MSRSVWKTHALRLIALVALCTLALQIVFAGRIALMAVVDPQSTSFQRSEAWRLAVEQQRILWSQQWVDGERISPHLKRAVIAAEDANFTEHDGVDWEAIERAHERNLKRGRVTHGGSTITMQLAKNLFLSGERSYLRKAQELAIAFMLEAVLGKARILEIYLNVAEWGVGVFGCEAAARRHFGTTADRLSPSQSARLAAMLPRPRFYDRTPQAPGLARRAETIQRWMGAITPP